MNKFVFLDIDGVLNSNFFFIERINSDNYEELREIYPQEVASGVSIIDQKAVKRLNKLLRETDAKLIVSSSWRHDPYLEDIFRASGIEAPIFDLTPSLESRVRGEEIKAWLDKQTEPYKYVILDDDCDILPEQFPYFVQTDCLKWGLDDNNVEIAIKKLNV